ncbi:MAG: ATP-binding protein [Bacteroidetes Order II. Incertae sedis bacterium]|nr:ATP-binding protein [Bacteroidetes Order II. bacterium]
MSKITAHTPYASQRPKLGVITQGSLGKGIIMRLDANHSVEQLKAGKFMVVEGAQYDFFTMITDVSLEAANPNILLNPPDTSDLLLRQVMMGHATYVTVVLKPLLMTPNGSHPDLGRLEASRVKTIPSHFSLVSEAQAEDIARIFGHEANLDENQKQRFFHVGAPLDMDEIPVCIDLDRLVERSNAVFGKTGTGKTFLTRLLICGTLKSDKAVNLIFDMHSEYGISARQEGKSASFVKGLRELFPGKVAIFSLDPESTRKRNNGINPDYEVFLYADQVEPEDILPLQNTLNLTQTAAESTYLLRNKLGKSWLIRLLKSDSEEELNELAKDCGANFQSVAALKRKLEQVCGLGFFKREPGSGKTDVIEQLLENILKNRSVVLEFGRYDSLKAYMFVANIITRRLRAAYEQKTNAYLSSRKEEDKPPQLMITIEEAHKFLQPGIASETPFGVIAREMRKYFVSLLIVDQRPSAIDDEVLSQIGTKIVAQLNDEKDLNAALVGTSDASGLRQVLASLDSKQQALVMGHAVPMPVVLKTRSYDEHFYAAMRAEENEKITDIRKQMKDLF